MANQKVYTRTGDKGTTSLFGGTRVGKDDRRLEAYGTLDELNSVLGVLISSIEAHRWPAHAALETGRVSDELKTLQAQLFVMGSQLATEAENQALRDKLPRLKSDDVQAMEDWMDRMSTDLEPLKNFILPGGSLPAAHAHLARTVARRAERAIVAASASLGAPRPIWFDDVVKHINRMNDYFFVLARHLNRLAAVSEPVWRL